MKKFHELLETVKKTNRINNIRAKSEVMDLQPILHVISCDPLKTKIEQDDDSDGDSPGSEEESIRSKLRVHSAKKVKRSSFTVEQKLAILEDFIPDNPTRGLSKVARIHNVDAKSVRLWYTQRHLLKMSLSNASRHNPKKRLGGGGRKANPLIEERVRNAVQQRLNEGLKLTDKYIRLEARDLVKDIDSSFDASTGWLTRFKIRNGFKNLTRSARSKKFSANKKLFEHDETFYTPQEPSTSFYRCIYRHLQLPESEYNFNRWLKAYTPKVVQYINERWKNLISDETVEEVLRGKVFSGAEIHAVSFLENLEIIVIDLDRQSDVNGTAIKTETDFSYNSGTSQNVIKLKRTDGVFSLKLDSF